MYEVTRLAQGAADRNTALVVGGTAEDPNAEPTEVGMVGFGINLPSSPRVTQDDPPCEIPPVQELILALARMADFAYTGGTIADVVDRILATRPGGMLGGMLTEIFGQNHAVCWMLAVRIPDHRIMTRIQTTVSSNDQRGAGAIFRVDPAVGHIQQYFSQIQAYRTIPDVASSRVASYSGARPEDNAFCGFGKPKFYNAQGFEVAAEHPTKVVAAVVFKNWSSTNVSTPLLRAYFR
jgi:hypothetical protein